MATVTTTKRTEVVFSLFERFWHWSQALLIAALMVTGFEVNGAYEFLGYADAASLHRIAAWSLLGLWIFATFWLFVSGEWKQYMPTLAKLVAVGRYYTVGIFDPRAEHPYKKTRQHKHNPLQRLAYLAFIVGISPVIWISGLLYMFYNDWGLLGLEGALSLEAIAFVHAAAAFGMLCFFIAHVYMVFTAKPLTKYLRAMITGKEEVYVEKEGDRQAAE